MLALLPSRWLGIHGLERRLSERDITKWVSRLEGQQVKVYLPRFKMETGFRLEQILEAMGTRLAFRESQADFSGINGKKDLHLSAAIHRAFVEVNEEGTEAAAATAFGVRVYRSLFSRPPAIPVFRADRPFVFLIRENRTGAILFLGKVVNPLAG
jgi:serpin B